MWCQTLNPNFPIGVILRILHFTMIKLQIDVVICGSANCNLGDPPIACKFVQGGRMIFDA